MRATYPFIDKNRRLHTFELFGYDFMLDEDLKLYLIEANINPCLAVTSNFSARFVPILVDNTLRIALDPLFPPPEGFGPAKKTLGDLLPELRYELVFDQRVEGAEIDRIYAESSAEDIPSKFQEMTAFCRRDCRGHRQPEFRHR